MKVKVALISAVAAMAAIVALGLVHLVGVLHQSSAPQTVWCKAVQPGAQYESNSVRYTLAPSWEFTVGTPAVQQCASLDGWQTFVPSAGP